MRPFITTTRSGYIRHSVPVHGSLHGSKRDSIIKINSEKVSEFWGTFHHAGKKHLSLGNIYKILDNTFYYGKFEYPKDSDQWYQGKHEPIITKELFDEVQLQLKGSELKTRTDKEFAFTKLMTCGLCGSGISADEKYSVARSKRHPRNIVLSEKNDRLVPSCGSAGSGHGCEGGGCGGG